MKLLDGILVLDFSQYLAGPSCAMRLADMGARVIKVERPGSGDSGRKMTLENLVVGKDSMNFLAINRGKESFCANMKDPEDLKILKALIKKADVMIENFRPGVMKKNGLDYASVSQWNPGIVYATVTGYGQEGPWKTKPGQDLLIQSMSGLAWLNGNGGDPPAPFGLSVVDGMTITIYHTGAHSLGEILLYIKEKDCIITGDCIQVRGTMNESGIGTFPLFVNVEHYIDALNKIKELNCTCVCTAHTGILTREEANELIKESFAFMLTHQEHIIDTLKKAEKPMALHEIVKELHGKYYQVYEMAYQIHATTHAQCQYLKAKGILKRVPHNGKLLWSIK